jgi:hypothetical protein
LEGYAACFDELFSALAQRRGFREYVTGLLGSPGRNKTLACLAGAEPVVGAQHRGVQRLQCFLTESVWDPEKINQRRVDMLLADPTTAPHERGVLVIDDSGDRKDGTATAHVGRQWLGRYGKTDSGIVTVTTLWADERLYYPLHAQPYTPAHHFPRGKNDPGFRTKPQIAAELALQAQKRGVGFRAVVADCAYGDNDTFRQELRAAGLPYVLALKHHKGTWGPVAGPHTPVDAAHTLAWTSPHRPGDWTRVTRTFRDGHTETWWAAEASLAGWGPDAPVRLVVATTDPARLPDKSTWYLITNLPRPGGSRAAGSPHRAADLAEIVRLYGLRGWIEQSYKQVKDELGWADFQVRSDIAIRRHQALVHCAFSFCWQTWLADTAPDSTVDSLTPRPEAGERGVRTRPARQIALLATSDPRRPRLADPRNRAHTLVASMVTSAPTT